MLANAKGATFDRSRFEEASMPKVVFEDVSLVATEFLGANLKSANFKGANLTGATFERADLRFADFQGANFQGEHAYPYALATNRGTAIRTVKTYVSFYGANLTKANFSNTILASVDFSLANLKDICWDSSTDWSNVRGLSKARNVPSELQRIIELS